MTPTDTETVFAVVFTFTLGWLLAVELVYPVVARMVP